MLFFILTSETWGHFQGRKVWLACVGSISFLTRNIESVVSVSAPAPLNKINALFCLASHHLTSGLVFLSAFSPNLIFLAFRHFDAFFRMNKSSYIRSNPPWPLIFLSVLFLFQISGKVIFQVGCIYLYIFMYTHINFVKI